LEITRLRITGDTTDVEFTDDEVFTSHEDAADSVEPRLGRVFENRVELYPEPADATAYTLRGKRHPVRLIYGETAATVATTAGTAAAPDLIIGGDANTGVYEAGADIWAVATAGASAFAVLADQSIIVGSTTAHTFTGAGKAVVFDEITAPAGTATNQAVIYAYDSGGTTVMAQQKSEGTNADL